MTRKIRLYGAVSLLALFLAGCSGPCSKIDPINAPALRSGSADFSSYVALGTSVSAGYQSMGLVQNHQEHAFPALFARQVGAPAFTYPAVTPPGAPPLLQLVSLRPLVIRPSGTTSGTWLNDGQPAAFGNLGVPGCFLVDVADTSLYYASHIGIRDFYFPHIARHRGSLLQQAMSLAPTFISLELGSNEVLLPALDGRGTPVLDAPTFTYVLDQTLGAIRNLAPGARLAIFNVPDVTTIPYFTTIKPFVVNPATGQPVLLNGHTVPLLGPGGPLTLEDYVLLTASDSLAVGTGIPAPIGNGRPLPDNMVLSAAEVTGLRAATDGYNQALQAAAAASGAALVDERGLLLKASTTGLVYQGVLHTSAFVTGGIFSLDGVHPTDLGQGFIANLMIDAVNAKFGAGIPYVSLAEAATRTASQLRRAREEMTGLPRVEGLREGLGLDRLPAALPVRR